MTPLEWILVGGLIFVGVLVVISLLAAILFTLYRLNATAQRFCRLAEPLVGEKEFRMALKGVTAFADAAPRAVAIISQLFEAVTSLNRSLFKQEQEREEEEAGYAQARPMSPFRAPVAAVAPAAAQATPEAAGGKFYYGQSDEEAAAREREAELQRINMTEPDRAGLATNAGVVANVG